MIDALISAAGDTVTVERVTDAVYDANDVLDRSASTVETEQVPAIVSSPSTEAMRRLEGRVDSAALQVSVPSSTAISTNRGGVRDRVSYGGRSYKVVDVRSVEHPFVDGVAKQTVMLAERGGH
jgi:hypothetical protein